MEKKKYGGPVCFLINKKHIDNFIVDYKNDYNKK